MELSSSSVQHGGGLCGEARRTPGSRRTRITWHTGPSESEERATTIGDDDREFKSTIPHSSSLAQTLFNVRTSHEQDFSSGSHFERRELTDISLHHAPPLAQMPVASIAPITGKLRKRLILDLSVALGGGTAVGYGYW